jgi:hypothetical protein
VTFIENQARRQKRRAITDDLVAKGADRSQLDSLTVEQLDNKKCPHPALPPGQRPLHYIWSQPHNPIATA